MGRVMGLLIALLTASGAWAEGLGETQTVTWEEVEGLRLSSVGYRSTDDPCRLAGETALTIDYLSDASDLVACPAGDPSIFDLIERLEGQVVGATVSYRLFLVPHR